MLVVVTPASRVGANEEGVVHEAVARTRADRSLLKLGKLAPVMTTDCDTAAGVPRSEIDAKEATMHTNMTHVRQEKKSRKKRTSTNIQADTRVKVGRVDIWACTQAVRAGNCDTVGDRQEHQVGRLKCRRHTGDGRYWGDSVAVCRHNVSLGVAVHR